QIFNRVDIVMGRRRNQAYARRGMTHAGNYLVHLVPRQLSPLTRFGPLRHFDLQITGVDEIFGGHAKTRRSHLLDGTTPPVSIGVRPEPFRIFATFACIALSTNAVHCNGKILMGLFADGTEGHGPSGKSLDNFSSRFNLIERNRVPLPKLEKATQCAEVLAL